MSQLPTQDIYSLEKLRQLWNEGDRFQFVYFWQNTKEDVSKEEYNSSCCNQWFPSNFVDENGRMYNCCEQYMMAQKAIVFGDDDTLQKILSEKNPSKIKKLGRIVKNYNQKIWNSKCQDIVFQGNLYKFTQNEKCRKFLLSVPKDAIFVEASPLDKKWGIRLSEQQPKAKNPLEWQGTNYLGFQITRVRDYIISHSSET